MREQAHAAFRLLQSGANVGKVVLRVEASGLPSLAAGSQCVTGGTGGLGLLTGRWLAGRGAHGVALVSRSGQHSTDARDCDWQQLSESTTQVVVQRCDTAETIEMRRLAQRVR